MIYLFLLGYLYLTNKSIRLIDQKIVSKKIELLNHNISNKDYQVIKDKLYFLELNKYRIILQEKLD